jgi:soluble lytic murein transglycosylase-like protein
MIVVCVMTQLPSIAPGAAPAVGPGVIVSNAELRRLVQQISLEHGVDPKLVDALVHVESSYNPRAVSRRGAMGLMQLMPDTVERLEINDPFDPEDNVRGGVREISRLVDRYSGNLQLALAAYNAGEGAVAKYRGVPPYPETRSYVSKILTIYTGRPYRLAGSYRAVPVRMVRENDGTTVITNLAPSAATAPALEDGPLRGGFSGR